MRDRTAKNLSTLHTLFYRATRGLLGRRFVNNDMLLLTTTGRTTGKRHTVPLLYLQDGADLVVIASWGGRHTNPQWYENLLRDPRVQVQVRGQRWTATAVTAGAADRARLWPRVLTAYDGYQGYQSKTDREIPVVILSKERN
jgi:deazaflavin-dependent oxidoreductase (nitroreductase family)